MTPEPPGESGGRSVALAQQDSSFIRLACLGSSWASLTMLCHRRAFCRYFIVLFIREHETILPAS